MEHAFEATWTTEPIKQARAKCIINAGSFSPGWIADRLNVQAYQHVLALDYGNGQTLHEVALRLPIGFIAGIDNSIANFRMAYRRNKKSVQRQLMHLQIGEYADLSYPPHYFHSMFSTRHHFPNQQSMALLYRVTGMLKIGGKMVMLISVPDNAGFDEVSTYTINVFRDAGYGNLQIDRAMNGSPVFAISGIRY